MKIFKTLNNFFKLLYFFIKNFNRRKYLKQKILNKNIYFIKNKNINHFDKLCEKILYRYYKQILGIEIFKKNELFYVPLLFMCPKKIYFKFKKSIINKSILILRNVFDFFIQENYILHYFDNSYHNLFIWKYHIYILDMENFCISFNNYKKYTDLPFFYFSFLKKFYYKDEFDKENLFNFIDYDLFYIDNNPKKILFYKLFIHKKAYNNRILKLIFQNSIIQIINFDVKGIYFHFKFYCNNKNYINIFKNNYKNFIIKKNIVYFFIRSFNLSDEEITSILCLSNIINSMENIVY